VGLAVQDKALAAVLVAIERHLNLLCLAVPQSL
jgi:hypothetical protein